MLKNDKSALENTSAFLEKLRKHISGSLGTVCPCNQINGWEQYKNRFEDRIPELCRQTHSSVIKETSSGSAPSQPTSGSSTTSGSAPTSKTVAPPTRTSAPPRR